MNTNRNTWLKQLPLGQTVNNKANNTFWLQQKLRRFHKCYWIKPRFHAKVLHGTFSWPFSWLQTQDLHLRDKRSFPLFLRIEQLHFAVKRWLMLMTWFFLSPFLSPFSQSVSEYSVILKVSISHWYFIKSWLKCHYCSLILLDGNLRERAWI